MKKHTLKTLFAILCMAAAARAQGPFTLTPNPVTIRAGASGEVLFEGSEGGDGYLGYFWEYGGVTLLTGFEVDYAYLDYMWRTLLTIRLAPDVKPGTYQLKVNGWMTAFSEDWPLTVIVPPLEITPASLMMYAGNTTNAAVVIATDWSVANPVTMGNRITDATLNNYSEGLRTLTVTSADTPNETFATSVTLVSTNMMSGGAAISHIVPVTIRARPEIFPALADDHLGHFHSDPVEAGLIMLNPNSSVTSVQSVTKITTAGYVTAYTVSNISTNSVTITPDFGAMGKGRVEIVVKDDVLGGTATQAIDFDMRDAVFDFDIHFNGL